MITESILDIILYFTSWATVLLIILLGVLVIVGVLNAAVVTYRTLRSPRRTEEREEAREYPLPTGIVSTYSYLHLLADVLLVMIAIELMDTLHAFLASEDPKAYILGALAAALVAIVRRIIVFFNPEAHVVSWTEIVAYAVLLGVLALSYAGIEAYL